MRITHCQVNHITNPLGFALGEPTFTWQVEEAAGSKAEASRLVVTCGGESVADTGWTDLSSLATQVEGLGAKLAARTRYEWRVSVRTDAGEEATSGVSWFETGKMAEPWEAAWVTCDATEPRHPIFSKALRLYPNAKVASARLYICGLGLYQAFIDGDRVGDEYLAPGTHAYDQWLQAQTYDVTDLVADGSVVSVLLGNGWYKGRFGFVKSDKGYYGDDWRLIAELRVTYADGSEQVIGTDDSWLVTRSTITFSNIYDGERRDDTLEATVPVAATLVDEPAAAEATAKLSDRLSLPVTAHELFENPDLIRTPAGEQVLDLGQNIAGTFRLRVDVPAGTEVRLQFGELLQDGNFYRDNLRTALAEYRYVSDGAPTLLEPAFTFYGYRYVKVEGADIDPTDFTGVALYSDFDAERGQITTGHAKVNQLISNARWGMKDNFLDTPTDCPQRDERMGWTGDANVFSGTALRLAAPHAFYAKYLHDMALEQATVGGLVPMVVPSFGMKGTGAVWGDVTCRIPWNMYQVDGDPEVLRQHFDSMKAWVDWIEHFDGTTHEWGKAMQFGDWLALDSKDPDGRRGGTDESFIAYVAWWESARTVADAARVLGRTEDEKAYQALADRIAGWIRDEYYTPNGRCAVNTQTAYVLSIIHGFGNRDFCAAQLRKLLQDNDGKLCTGFVGTPLLCPALSQVGLDREAYQLLLNEDYPGWLYCVNLGATTIWERWNSLDAAGHITGTDMNSLNHYSYGAIVEWLWSYAAGITPAEPGFVYARIAPAPNWGLRSLDARIRTAAGAYRVAWECVDENHLHVAIEVPFGTEAQVELPLAPESAYVELGGHTLAAGTYELTYETTAPLRRVPSVDWTVAQILDDREVSAVVRQYVDGWDFSMLSADPTKTLRQLQAEGLGQNRKMTADELATCDAALHELAE